MTEIQYPLRILQVNTVDQGGGAAGSAWNLFNAYHKRDHHSWLAVGYKRSSDPYVLHIPNDEGRNCWARLWLSVNRLGKSLYGKVPGAGYLSQAITLIGQPYRYAIQLKGWEDFDFPGTWRLLELTSGVPDIVHCHNLHGGYFDLRALPWLSHQVPVILNLRDAWLLSGHCAHSLDCERWKTGCGECPDLTIYPAIRRDATAYNWRRKRDIYARSRLYVTTPSHWLMDKVQQSMLAPTIIEARVIPNGVDLRVFHPGGRSEARAALGVPQDVKVLLAVGNRIRSSRWRDYSTLERAVQRVANQLPDEHIILICLGEKGERGRTGNAEVWFIDYQREQRAVAQFYQAADVYIHATKADTFPNTVLEALACGTPVVATSVGGVPEQIEDGRNGFLVPPADPEAMAARIEQILCNYELRCHLESQAAESAGRCFDLERQANDFLMWYNEILEDWRGERLIAKSR